MSAKPLAVLILHLLASGAAIITDAVRSVPVQRVGYSGLMVPVLEDTVLARRWDEGKYSIDSLLAFSAVCATGLDTVPLAGDVTEEQLGRVMTGVAALSCFPCMARRRASGRSSMILSSDTP